MREVLWIALALALGLAFGTSCHNPSANAETSSKSRGGETPSRTQSAAASQKQPLKGLSFVFIHHSCGSGFLHEGKMKAKLEALGVRVHDITYGDGWIGDNTNPDHFPTTFGRHMDEVLGWELAGKNHHDIVAFKSCFPASNISSEGMLAQYKKYYEQMKPMFEKQPRVLFVAWTAPPLVPRATTSENAARMRRFCHWLVNDWAPQEHNIAVFDCFHVLAGKDDYLRPGYRRNEHDSHPNAAGNRAVADAFTKWLPRAVDRWRE